MLRISEFSKLSHLTIKALRFYEKEGLLKPAAIDEWNNYRFYETSQLHVRINNNAPDSIVINGNNAIMKKVVGMI